MDFLVSIYPGIGFTSFLVLFFLGLGQAWYYKTTRQTRARDIAIFCIFSGLFALNIAIAHSREFSTGFTWFYAIGLQPVFFITFFFYMKSMSYFVFVPRWLKKSYYYSQVALGVASAIPGIYYLASGVDLAFVTSEPMTTGNYFMDSYTTRFGAPTIYLSSLLALSSLVNMIAASVLLRRVYQGSKDAYLMGGLAMTIFCLGVEHLGLPFDLSYYVPVLFLSNMLEALRMCFLSTEENEEISRDEKLRQNVERTANAFANTSLSEERISSLTEQLQDLMEKEKLYENPSVMLEDIAHEMGIPSYQLSQVIRFGLNKNFYDMINSYRVAQVQEMLLDPKHGHETILDIAFQAGFNSKSSFNQAFKKQTGMTPSEFRKGGEESDSTHH